MLPQPNRAAGWRAPPSAAARCSHLSSSNPLQGSSLASPGLGPCGSGVPRPSGAWASPGRLEPAGSSALLDMTGCASPLDRKRSEIRHRQGPIPRLPRTIVKCPPASLQVQSLLQAQIRPSCQASGAPAARDIQGWREHAAAAARRAADGAAMGCRSGGTRRHVPFPVPLPRRVTSAVHPTQPSVARFRAQGRRARGSELNVCVCVCACVCVCGGGGGGGRPPPPPAAEAPLLCCRQGPAPSAGPTLVSALPSAAPPPPPKPSPAPPPPLFTAPHGLGRRPARIAPAAEPAPAEARGRRAGGGWVGGRRVLSGAAAGRHAGARTSAAAAQAISGRVSRARLQGPALHTGQTEWRAGSSRRRRKPGDVPGWRTTGRGLGPPAPAAGGP
jgi:hypothetical protein